MVKWRKTSQKFIIKITIFNGIKTGFPADVENLEKPGI